MPRTITDSTFARPAEADAYRLLHESGIWALDDHYGVGVSRDLLNRWVDRGLARVSWDTNGCMKVRTFKKYVPADHNWVVIDNRTKKVIFTDRTCQGARAWATGVTGQPTSRVRAGLYVAASRLGNLTVTASNDPYLDAIRSEG